MNEELSYISTIPSDLLALVKLLVALNIILISVILIFLFIRYLIPYLKKLLIRRNKEIADIVVRESPEEIVTGDKAAVAMALYLYFNEMHDQESDIITVKRVSKTYSPWSSKLYSMRNLR